MPITPADLSLLESTLLKLGQQELALERKIKDLLRISREMGRSGRFDEADAAWEMREQLQAALTTLQADIMRVERTLYAQRAKRR